VWRDEKPLLPEFVIPAETGMTRQMLMAALAF
jgi:hypothetical protein